jgi:tRNA-2-methylthio-N6-dimethylallyladenosine synthase
VPVLFAEPGRRPGQLIGKTPWLQSVYVEGPQRLIGQIVETRLIAGYPNSLAGEIAIREEVAA